MFDIQKRLSELKESFSATWEQLDLDMRLFELETLEAEVNVPEIWNNPDVAREKTTKVANLHDELDEWLLLRTQIEDISTLIELSSDDESMLEECSSQLSAMEEKHAKLRLGLRFTGKYDHNDAILRITAGAGGTEAMDWASMLERMYLRWAENEKVSARELERTDGEEAGVKTVVIELDGRDVYGKLKSEHGTHRLVRLSPFNADHLRQTSFAGVEVLPVIRDDSEVRIDPKDLRIDTYHSGGHGGQSVNTTNSAIRITHIPTNTVVAIQNERRQLQNKEKAMEILRGKLAQMQLEQHAATIGELRAGESAGWGQQIRNYVLQPYKLVKDTRTGHESKEPDKILDGEIDEFVETFLENMV
jgi:peptide chain release factor 2